MKYLFFIFVWLTLLVPQRLHAQSFDFDEEETDSNETSSDFSFPLKFKVSTLQLFNMFTGRYRNYHYLNVNILQNMSGKTH